MDYEGQKLSELIFYIIIILFGSIGWVIGYIHQDFFICVKAWFAGLVLSIILCVPDWPFYNRNPVKWLPSLTERRKQE